MEPAQKLPRAGKHYAARRPMDVLRQVPPLALPNTSKKYIAAVGLRSKTDKIDAYGLALMGAERRLPAWGGSDPFRRRLRAMIRNRANLQDQRMQMRNQLHALDHSGPPKVERCIENLSQQIGRLTGLITDYARSQAYHNNVAPPEGEATINTSPAAT